MQFDNFDIASISNEDLYNHIKNFSFYIDEYRGDLTGTNIYNKDLIFLIPDNLFLIKCFITRNINNEKFYNYKNIVNDFLLMIDKIAILSDKLFFNYEKLKDNFLEQYYYIYVNFYKSFITIFENFDGTINLKFIDEFIEKIETNSDELIPKNNAFSNSDLSEFYSCINSFLDLCSQLNVNYIDDNYITEEEINKIEIKKLLLVISDSIKSFDIYNGSFFTLVTFCNRFLDTLNYLTKTIKIPVSLWKKYDINKYLRDIKEPYDFLKNFVDSFCYTEYLDINNNYVQFHEEFSIQLMEYIVYSIDIIKNWVCTNLIVEKIDEDIIKEYKYNYNLLKRTNEDLLTKNIKSEEEIAKLNSRIKFLNTSIKKLKLDFKDKIDFSDLNSEKNEKAINLLQNEAANEILNETKNTLNEDFTLQIKTEVEKLLGNENSQKISEDSEKFIISSLIMYEGLSKYTDNVDYSGVCLTLVKALENECHIKFYEGFKLYMNEIYGNNFQNYPLWFLKKYKKNNIEITNVINSNDFTLGTMVYLTGYYNKKGDKNSDNVLDFCKERLFIEKDKNIIKSKLYKLGEDINTVRENYRNPAAHIDTLSKINAKECIDYLLKVKKVFQELLSMCK